ncbi:MAG: aminotransferase class IV [Bacteroidetes bacterium]|nr:aminotransferase class IV [Bacteroidota bacterium]
MNINFNGKLIPRDSFCLTLDNRAFKYADAVCETVKIVEGRILFWEAHYFQLMAAMRIFRMRIPMHFDLEFLESEIHKVILPIQKVQHVTLTVFREASPDTQNQQSAVSYLLDVKLGNDQVFENPIDNFEVEIYKDFYVSASMLSTLHTPDRHIALLAQIFVDENGYQDCLLVNEHKNVIGTTTGSLFWVKGTQIKTPPLSDGCKNDVLRNELITRIKKSALYEIEESSISPFALQHADELFKLNLETGIQPVSRYRKKNYNREVAGFLRDDILSEIL